MQSPKKKTKKKTKEKKKKENENPYVFEKSDNSGFGNFYISARERLGLV